MDRHLPVIRPWPYFIRRIITGQRRTCQYRSSCRVIRSGMLDEVEEALKGQIVEV
jgi:hypothetical protein